MLRKVQCCQLKTLKGLPKAQILPAGREVVSEGGMMNTQKSEHTFAECQTPPPAFQTKQVIGKSGVSDGKTVCEATKPG